MLLSVVIPMYHVEAYLPACLTPAGELPLDGCEILLVDDCGGDGSLALAEAFAQEHPNARVLRRAQNGGLSAARNTGLQAARGEYVYFLDSDDEPCPQALWRLAERAKEERLDIAKGRFCSMDDATGALSEGLPLPRTRAMPGAALFARECRDGLYEPMVWQAVYRRDFLREIGLEMAEGLIFEDELFQTPALLRAARAASFEETIVRYRRREGSIMDSFRRTSRWCDSYLAVCRRLSRLAREVEYAPARRALRKRVGQIALSVGKNIAFYGLTGAVRDEAVAFLTEHRAELSRYALSSQSALVAAQGALLFASPGAFLALYARARRAS